MIQAKKFRELKTTLESQGVTLVAVSKTQSPETILKLYNRGQRIFGENRVQELLEKCHALPDDIQWHLIGHLQTNKVRQVLPVAAMIASVDSTKLLELIHTEAINAGRVIDILLQIKISKDATKYGFDPLTVVDELNAVGISDMTAVRFRGVMGIASLTENAAQIREEFQNLKKMYSYLKNIYFGRSNEFDQISMGMSGDFQIAIDEGSTMVRIGSLLFGERG